MVLVGPLGAGAVALLASLRHEHGARLRRFAFRSLLFAGLPPYIAMFVSGEWITSKEGLGGEDDPAWFVIGIVGGDCLVEVERAPRPGCGRAFRVRAGRMCGRRLGDDGEPT
jgi:hypothetical protein